MIEKTFDDQNFPLSLDDSNPGMPSDSTKGVTFWSALLPQVSQYFEMAVCVPLSDKLFQVTFHNIYIYIYYFYATSAFRMFFRFNFYR